MEDIVNNATGGLIVEVVKCTFGPVKRHLSYFFNHESKVKSLNDQLQKLKEEEERMQHRVDAAERGGLRIMQDAQNWLTNVHKMIMEDAKELQKYEDEAKKRCFVGLCPDFMFRYHVSKKAKEEASLVAQQKYEDEAKKSCFFGLCPDFMFRYNVSKKAEEEAILVAQLLDEANQFSTKEISFRPDPQQVVAASAPQGYEPFQSRQVVLQDILKALKDPSIHRIGVFGMGGVGKTMLMKEVAFIAKRENLFDEIAIATISNFQKTKTRRIQKEISNDLGLKFEGPEPVPNELRQRLNNGKKILVILDDIWKEFDLETAGIIFEQNQNMCKLLLSSRNSDTLCINMKVERTFELTVLSPEESMLLFGKIVGNKAEEPDYKRVAIDVVAKCAGLPVAISAVAKALKEKNIDIWKNALHQLKRANPRSIEGVEENVYSALKFSYEYLQYKPAQTLLLLCSLWPQGQEILISDLIKCIWGMDLLEDVYTMQEARNNVTTLIQKLKNSSLLLSGDIDTVFRMHDVVRDVCISIAGEDNQMFVVDEQVHFEKLLEGRKLKNCVALSLLPYGDIGELPEKLNCPELQFFCCESADRSLEVADVFFKETKMLKVLDLTAMELSSLPSSFLSLTNLQTLCLDHCMLQDIAIVGRLKNLEVLSVSYSNITKLSIQLANLTKLKLLDLSNCCNLKFIPANLIPRLWSLEELYMDASFDDWDVEGNASLSELKDLNKLTALNIGISDVRKIPEDLFFQNLERYDVEKIPKNLFFQNLERYKIHIRNMDTWCCDKPERSRLLYVELDTDMYLGHGFEMLLKKTEDLRFSIRLEGVREVISMLENAGSHLKDLCISTFENRGEMTKMSSLMLPLFNHKVMFCYLEHLELCKINNPSIWNNEPSTWPTNLTSLYVFGCDNLKHLFSTSMARCLKQLKNLTVMLCESLIDIIVTEVEERKDVILFPHLDFLILVRLPKLERFSENLIKFSSLRTLHIAGCDVLKSFMSNAATVETSERKETKRNDLEEDKSYNISTLFNEKMLAGLRRLDELWIFCCNSVEEIFECEEPNLGNSTTIKFELPTLTELKLHELPKLRSFSCKTIECPSLRRISVKECDQVQLLFCSEEYTSFGKPQQQKESQQPLFWVNKIGFPSLEELTIESNENLEQIWEGQLPSQCSLKLKYMVLSSTNKLFCEGLKGVLPMVQLSQLSLANLDELIRWAWDENFEPFRPVFNELTSLEVSWCKEWKNLLVPSSISFSNLVTMTISYCHPGLISLLTHSTAKSLVHLTTMVISSCDEIKEIIANDGAEDGIIFPQLKSVVLYRLKSLEGFCLGNCSIKFLSLDQLNVTECPKMRNFCQGEVVTPKLQSVGQLRSTPFPVKDGDLNNSIQVGCNIGSSDEVDEHIEEQPF